MCVFSPMIKLRKLIFLHFFAATTKRKLQRKISICSESEVPEEQKLNYLEIGSIPPLPLFALFAADDDGYGEAETDKLADNKSVEVDAFTSASDLFSAKPQPGLLDETLDFEKELQQMGHEDDEAAETRRKLLEETVKSKAKLEFKKSLLSEVYATNLASRSFNSKASKCFIEKL